LGGLRVIGFISSVSGPPSKSRIGAAAVPSDSDLVGIPVALGAILAILVVFGAFFFIGAVTGLIVLFVVVLLAVLLLVRWIQANELD
jgi:hypothetical protein